MLANKHSVVQIVATLRELRPLSSVVRLDPGWSASNAW
jgi:hypothetical protein